MTAVPHEARYPHGDEGITRRGAVQGDTIGDRSTRLFGRCCRAREDCCAAQGSLAIGLAAGDD